MSPILRLLQLTLIFDDVDRSDLIFFGLSLILGYAALCSLFVAFMVRFDANNGDETVTISQLHYILMSFHVYRLLYFR